VNTAGFAAVAAAGVVAGAMNSAAGGGSFISFPTLVLLGVPPIPANATNTTAMWIGQGGSIPGFREDMQRPTAPFVLAMLVSIVGGIVGAVVLLHTPQHAFNAIIPWLLLFSTVMFAISPWLLKLTRSKGATGDLPWSSAVPLFVIAVYGGYFGGGQGLVMLAYFALAGMTDIRRMNALKSVLCFINNGVPVIPFVIAGAIVWNVAVVMSAGALVGGYFGARIARRVPPEARRIVIVVLGTIATIGFFLRDHA
jgi:uncharacterized membrane protein YfcA